MIFGFAGSSRRGGGDLFHFSYGGRLTISSHNPPPDLTLSSAIYTHVKFLVVTELLVNLGQQLPWIAKFVYLLPFKMRGLTALAESKFLKPHLLLDVPNLDFLGLYACKALESMTPARQDKAVPHYDQRKLVGPRWNSSDYGNN
jgi:hypothetical protein